MNLYKFSIIFLILCVILAVLAPIISFYDPNMTDLSILRQAPNLYHIFGTDFLGRDEFSRLLYALRSSIIVGFFSGVFSLLFAFIFVCITWLMPLAFKNIMMRILEGFLSLPNLLLILLFGAMINDELNPFNISILIASFLWASVAKVIYDEFLSISKSEFITNAIGLGTTKLALIFREILPVAKNIIFVLFITSSAHAISTEATLSFFGVGLPLAEASLGNMLNEANRAIFVGAWWLVITPGLVIFLIIFSMMIIGEKLQENK